MKSRETQKTASDRVIYLKGGRAIEEAQRLFPRVGELPDGGPDKFLLAILHFSRDARLRLTSFGPAYARLELLGREVIEYGARPISGSMLMRRMAFASASLRFVWDTLCFKPTRVLCGQDGPFALCVWLAARLSGAQFIFLAHNALALPSTSSAYRISNTWLSKHSDLIVAHGPFLRDEAVRLGARPEKVLECNNALDPSHARLIASLPSKAMPYSDEKIVLYVGRIEKDKGVFDLLDAVAQLRDIRNIRLRFIGDGTARETLHERVAQRQMQHQVEVLGPVPFEAVFAHMKQATVIAAPSQSSFPEGLCKSVMEAFYVGTPVIAPNYGPFPYLVKHDDNGLLYQSDNVAALSEALRHLLTDATFCAQLEAGALKWGEKLMNPSTTFAQAIRYVFSVNHQKTNK